MHYKKYFLFFFLTISYSYAQWQGSDRKMPAIGVLKGSISDSTSGAKIEYASITLISLRSNQIVSGALSNKEGEFYIKEIPLGRYKAVIEFIGYKTRQFNPINIIPGQDGSVEQNLGDIKLSVSSINLSQVDVLGESQFIQTIDKQVFTVGKNLASSGGSGEDVLNQVPTVAVDIDGQITLRGDANVTVLIDGKKVGFDRRTLVDNLQASMIEKVEVITNPSAKYDPDGVGGIINLVLKRGTFDGFNGSTTLSAGEFNKNNLSGNLNFRTDKWNVFGSASYRTGERYGTGLREFDFLYYNPNDSIRYLYQKTERLRNSDNVSFRFGGDIYPSSSSNISYTSTFNVKNQDGQELIKTTKPIPSILDIKEVEEESNWDHSISYENKFDSKNEKLNANLSYSYGNENKNENNISQNLDPENRGIKNRNNFQSTIASLDYENKFGSNLVIETGLKTTQKKLGDDLFFYDDKYDYLYDENIYALYATMGYDLSDRFGLKGGLRFEQVETLAKIKGDTTEATSVTHHVVNMAVDDGAFDNPYSHFYPSLFANYKLTEKSQVQFGYSKRVNRPGTGSINPFPNDMLDTTRVRNGNPFVKPEFSDVMEINFSSNSRKFNLNTGISYKHTDDPIAWWDRDEIIFNGKSYELLTAGNAESAKSLGGSVIVNYRPMPLISLMLTTWWWRNETSGGQYEDDLSGQSQGMFNRGQLTINIPTLAKIELSVGGRATMKITSGKIPANYGADLGIEKSFLDNKLSATIKVDDLFNNRRFIIDTEENYEFFTQEMYAERKRGRRTASLNLRYNFGKEQKKKWGRRNFGRGGNRGGGMDMDY